MTFREKIFKTTAILLKNLLAFLLGGALGMLATIVFAEPLLKSVLTKDMGLGVIVLAPFFLIFYSIIFGALCGIIAVAVYNIAKIFRKYSVFCHHSDAVDEHSRPRDPRLSK